MKSSKWWKQQQDPSTIKLPPTAHVALVRCRVQLLGRAAPYDTPDGLYAMQKPLHELYENYSPVESVLTAYTSGFVILTPANVEVGAEELWFPIQNLMECGAMRAIGVHPELSFAPLSTAPAKGSKRPALFAFIFKRQDIPTSDCWAVECKSDDAAMALLTACMLAHKSPAGWASTVDRPPSAITNAQVTARAPPSEEWDGAAAKEAGLWNKKFQREYYEKPPLQGFYYTPAPGLIQNYAIRETLEEDTSENGESMTHDESMTPDTKVGQQPMRDDSARYLPYGDAYYPYDMSGQPAQGEPFLPFDQTDMYGFPPGMAGTFVPESLIYPDDNIEEEYRHRKKKKSKKSKHSKDKQEKDVTYNYFADDGMMVVPQETIMVGYPGSGISEEPFESHLPAPADHYVVKDYDPAWHYDMKSYIRDQQYVSGYTDPVSHRPYERHIDEFPPADYHMDGPYDDDDGPYEHRLPVAGRRAAESDPKMLNENFIIRQREDYRKRL